MIRLDRLWTVDGCGTGSVRDSAVEPGKVQPAARCSLVVASLGAVTEDEVAAFFRPEAIERSPGRLRVPGVGTFLFETLQGAKSRTVTLSWLGAVIVPSKGTMELMVRGEGSSARAWYNATNATGRRERLDFPADGGKKLLECQRTVNNEEESFSCVLRGVEMANSAMGACP